MLDAPTFEQTQIEAVRDLTNLGPAMEHRLTDRIRRIRARLADSKVQADEREAEIRERLEDCSWDLWRLLSRIRLVYLYVKEEEQLKAAFEAVERACDEADGLLHAAKRVDR